MITLKEPARKSNPLLSYVYRSQQERFQVVADEITHLEQLKVFDVSFFFKSVFFKKGAQRGLIQLRCRVICVAVVRS